MEAIGYGVYLAITLGVALQRDAIGRSITWRFLAVWFAVSLGLLVCVRCQGLDADMVGYTAVMQSESWIHSRPSEPLLWRALTLLYWAMGNEIAVLLTLDAVGLALLGAALWQLRVPRYVFFAIVIFFPVVLGMQNAYRQYFSMVLFLGALATADRSVVMAAGQWIMAVLTHNAALALAPLLVARSRVRAIRLAAIPLALAVDWSLIEVGRIKGTKEVGYDFSLLYVLVVCGLLLATLRGPRRPQSGQQCAVLERIPTLAAVVIMVGAQATLSSVWIERFGMFILTVLFPQTCGTVEAKSGNSRVCRVGLILACSLPLVLVHTTRKFIIPAE